MTDYRARRILSLGLLIVSGASLVGWMSPWLGVLAFAVGVGGVVLDLHERRKRGADDPAVLDLRG